MKLKNLYATSPSDVEDGDDIVWWIRWFWLGMIFGFAVDTVLDITDWSWYVNAVVIVALFIIAVCLIALLVVRRDNKREVN